MWRADLLPAPKRGAYDRSQTRAERNAEQRERLFVAAAQVIALGPLTIGKVVELAGVGRNTFYEFFDDPEHLLLELERRVLRELEGAFEAALANARTPLERVRAVSRAWFGALAARPLEARVALAVRDGAAGDALSPAGELLRRTLDGVGTSARAEVGWTKGGEATHVLAAAAAVEALSRRHLSTGKLREPPQVMIDIVVRLLR